MYRNEGKTMIYTVTLNPTLDYFVDVPDFKMGHVSRTESEILIPGGKGINVSVVLKNLGVDNTAIYYSAGFVGKEITRRIAELGINTEEVVVKEGISRINVKIVQLDGTEINGIGPTITEEDLDVLMKKVQELKEDDILVLGGSIPDSVPDTIYRDIMASIDGKGIHVVVDATKDLLTNVLEYHPFLIKPNNYELGDIFDVQLTSREAVIPYAFKLQEMGARNVLVSLAGEGAVLVTEMGDVYECEAPKGNLVSSVGAGDSMVAGFIYGYTTKRSYNYALDMGVSAGSASAFSDYLATRDQIMDVYNSLNIGLGAESNVEEEKPTATNVSLGISTDAEPEVLLGADANIPDTDDDGSLPLS